MQGLYPDKALAPELFYLISHYECYCCKALTGWQVLVDNDYFMNVCSTECYEAATGTKPEWKTNGEVGNGDVGKDGQGEVQLQPALPKEN